MPLTLPAAINRYFTADSISSNDITQHFTKDAIVIDEKQTYQGRDAIRQWKADVTTKFTYRSEPFACEEIDGKTIVTSKLTGNFPGSPVDLRYIFKIDGDKIAYLEITP